MRKEKETDFINEDRPNTRLAQFGDIFKHRFVELLKISLLQAVFNMPFIVSLVLFYALVRNSPDVNALMTVFLIQGGSLLVSLPCMYIGMTGTFYCMKKLAYAEGEFASSSFFIGLREEWKSGAFVGFLVGISGAVAVIGFFFAHFYLAGFDAIMSGFAIAMVIIQFIVISIVGYYSISQIIVYSNKMRYVLKNSFLMTLSRFPMNLIMVIIYPGILVALFAIMEITMYVGIGLLIFFAAFGHLGWMLLCLSAFDAYINITQHPEIYRQGLAKIEEEPKED